MSSLEEHEEEQARITAECEAGECDHPHCHEDSPELPKISLQDAARAVAINHSGSVNEDPQMTEYMLRMADKIDELETALNAPNRHAYKVGLSVGRAKDSGRVKDPFKGTKLMFCDILTTPEIHFAWLPKKCFDGRWVWLRPVWARLCVIKTHLARGPEKPWWQYARVKGRTHA